MPGREDIAARFDSIAPTYEGGGVHRWLAEQVARRAIRQYAGRVLDVATGTGLVVVAMADLGSTGEFVGVDISAGMLAEAAGRSNARLLLADGDHLPFGDDTFDLAICVAAMAYFADPVRALAEWNRVTRGGRIIFTAWTRGGLTLQRLVRQAAAEAGVELPDPSAALDSEDGIRAITARAGLKVERMTVVAYDEPLREEDHAAWERILAGDSGAVMRAADHATRSDAGRRFRGLLDDAIGTGLPNRSSARIVECRRVKPAVTERCEA